MSEANEVETTETSGRTRVGMKSFIETWEDVANSKNRHVQIVADRLGLKKESVQQRATKYRNPPTKRVVIDKASGKPVKVDGRVQYTEIPVSERAVAINLSPMSRGGGAKLDSAEGANLLAKLKAEREAAASE